MSDSHDSQLRYSGNPLLEGKGVTDPHVRIFNDRAYMYATHDRGPDSQGFKMDNWWIWASNDLVEWTCECVLKPEQTYIGEPFSSCWATDAAERNGHYYWYFSEGNQKTGVVVGESPTGPWRDPLGRPLIDDSVVPTKPYDPGVFVDDDGEAYLVFGVWEYYVARLAEDMISLAEAPRKVEIINPEGPYGPGKLDDKPYLHKRGDVYYLSWGCYYGMSDSVYGPYDCQGSIILEENVHPSLRYSHKPLTFDRHGSFFQWRDQWYFICNDMSRTGKTHFRDSSICYVTYRDNGRIEPVKIDPQGVAAVT